MFLFLFVISTTITCIIFNSKYQVFVNGMYAFVLYDSGRDEYFVARDPIGICPLYIGYDGNGRTWFSSELKGLQAHCDHIEVGRSKFHVKQLCNRMFRCSPRGTTWSAPP